MTRCLLILILGFIAVRGGAQTTFRITTLPASTPAKSTLYMVGGFNKWNPADSAYALTLNQDGRYQITLPASVQGPIEFKFTRGTWGTVETNNQNNDLSNRQYVVTGTAAVVEVTVENWKDSGKWKVECQSTRQANVRVISTRFAMPQLNRTRRVWVYLPPDYETAPTKRYPVLYMHDGQNVFDACTSFSGEWEVDEALNKLQQQGLDARGSIVVAVDNGGAERLNELSPWRNPEYGGGQGAAYVDFMARTLKPYIDATYRTLSGREFTGMAGSSMGGLISTYAALRYPAVYSKVGVLSPAFWFAKDSLFNYLQQHPPQLDTRFYFVSGTTESETMVPLMQAVRDSLSRVGKLTGNDLHLTTATDGKHAEWFWQREFPAAYQWLYTSATADALAYSVYRGKTAGYLTVQLPATGARARLEVRSIQGQRVIRQRVHSGSQVDVRRLPKGSYVLRLASKQQTGEQGLLLE